MAIRKSEKETIEEIQIMRLDLGRVQFHLLGTSPMIYHAMSEKAKHELLLPSGRKTAAHKASSLKHNPMAEFLGSFYQHRGDDHPTRLKFPAVAFKKAIAKTALDIPGVAKTEIERLTYAQWADVNIYGVPQLHMCVVRMADMNKTPDIRTRGIIERWATSVTINYVKPKLNHTAITNLLAASGMICGIGDGRQEKGAFSFGQFEIVSEDDPRYLDVIKNGGREAQDAAIANPKMYDLETEELLSWYTNELKRRGKDEPATQSAATKRGKKNSETNMEAVQ